MTTQPEALRAQRNAAVHAECDRLANEWGVPLQLNGLRRKEDR